MLSKKERLKRSDFLIINSLTKDKIQFSLGVLVFLKTESPKSAIVLSKKLIRSSPKRHLYKRAFFNLLKNLKNNNKTQYSDKNVSVLLILKKKPNNLLFIDELCNLIKQYYNF